jgi:hypothetical protein
MCVNPAGSCVYVCPSICIALHTCRSCGEASGDDDQQDGKLESRCHGCGCGTAEQVAPCTAALGTSNSLQLSLQLESHFQFYRPGVCEMARFEHHCLFVPQERQKGDGIFCVDGSTNMFCMPLNRGGGLCTAETEAPVESSVPQFRL